MNKYVAIGAAAFLLSACGAQFDNISNIGRPSDPARFYVLTPVQKTENLPMGDVVIGVGPVTTADYLDRSQMVVRDSANHIELQEFDRWAGSLAKEVQKVMVANITTLSGSSKVLHYPWKTGVDTDYTLEVYIEQMDYDQGEAVLIAQWQLYDAARELVLARRSLWKAPVEKDFGKIAQALSGHMEKFSEEVVREMASLHSFAGTAHKVKNSR